jgi:hypothetical protein
MLAGSNPDARRLVETERAHIREVLASLKPRFDSWRETIGGLLALLQLRQRYFALVGEHFSVFDFDGITAMDQLDEALLLAAHDVLARRPPGPPDADADRALGESFKSVPKSQEHPVGYMILFQIRKMFEAFDGFLQEQGDMDDEDARAPYESAFVARVVTAIGAFASSRQTPIVRHFGDLAREYSVVARLHCKCGQSKFEVKKQSLHEDSGGGRLDRLDVQCGSCGDTRELDFPLPHFSDLSIASS